MKNYKTKDGSGWSEACDDLFLAQFRGKPCEICSATSGYYGPSLTRSMGHHLLGKKQHRKWRYDVHNIIVLCPGHHLGERMSPHAHDNAAVAEFYVWLYLNKPDAYNLMRLRRDKKFDNEWNYRDKYIQLGGDIRTKTGFAKDMKPFNHKESVEAENE